ncbi:MAG: MoaD/ThiS family protein [Armatimonadetes bacterium]|nr:MoaD/ThiS family protein [Armatimonadota bacterium]
MAVEIRIPAALRRFTGGARRVEVAAGTLAEVLAGVFGQHPDLRGRMLTAEGGLRADARVFIAGDEPEQGLATAVGDGAEVTILPPIAGA